MTFNESNLKAVLEFIEEHLHFRGDNITNPQHWDLSIDANIQELLDKHPNEKDKIRYTLRILDYLEYIKIDTNSGAISGVFPEGYKFLFKYLHNIDFQH